MYRYLCNSEEEITTDPDSHNYVHLYLADKLFTDWINEHNYENLDPL